LDLPGLSKFGTVVERNLKGEAKSHEAKYVHRTSSTAGTLKRIDLILPSFMGSWNPLEE
jgi:hypothetical protein